MGAIRLRRRYGTLRSEIDRIAEERKVCVLELELDGTLRVRTRCRAA